MSSSNLEFMIGGGESRVFTWSELGLGKINIFGMNIPLYIIFTILVIIAYIIIALVMNFWDGKDGYRLMNSYFDFNDATKSYHPEAFAGGYITPQEQRSLAENSGAQLSADLKD